MHREKGETNGLSPIPLGVQARHLVQDDSEDVGEESADGQLGDDLGQKVRQHTVHVQAPLRLPKDEHNKKQNTNTKNMNKDNSEHESKNNGQ